jgi:hypothetical protein
MVDHSFKGCIVFHRVGRIIYSFNSSDKEPWVEAGKMGF